MVSSIFSTALKNKVQNALSRKVSNNLIPEIDGFRFFAIATVVLYHLNTHFYRSTESITAAKPDVNLIIEVLGRGGLGVNVFFAISGFILALPFARHRLFNDNPVKLKDYYIRRITRIEPPYIVSLLLLLLVHLLILHENFKSIFPNFLASTFYLHSIFFDAWSKINPVAWSLEVEVQFYALAPALALVFRIKNSFWRRSVIVIVIFISAAHANLNYEMIAAWHLRKSLFMHLHQFLVGFLFVDYYLTDWSGKLKQKNYLFDLIGLSAIGFLFLGSVPFNFAADLLFTCALFVLFITLFKGKLFNSFFTNTWIVILGGMCYSIYLLHYALIALVMKYSMLLYFEPWGYIGSYFIQLLIVVPSITLVCAFFFVMIERPCMDKNWPIRVWNKLTSSNKV
jgi:peptidoglycan/LPS O-acetylase OafA/YrhL